jgi:hypothetical protein
LSQACLSENRGHKKVKACGARLAIVVGLPTLGSRSEAE